MERCLTNHISSAIRDKPFSSNQLSRSISLGMKCELYIVTVIVYLLCYVAQTLMMIWSLLFETQ